MPISPDSLIAGFPQILHGADYYPDQWLDEPGVIDEDFRLMRVGGMNTMAIGVFAWSRLEPSEGQYDFGWMDELVDRFAREKVNLLLATPSGAKPLWMSEKYEEIRRVNRLGTREFSGWRHNFCWSSPVYREKVRAINTEIARRYGKHPALKMWHVSNEYNGECFCPLCLGRFRDWLGKRYGSLEAVNKAYWADFWGHRFTDWKQIDPRMHEIDGLALDWHRFRSWQVEDFYLWEVAPLKAAAPEIPAFSNIMGFHLGMDYRAICRHMDVVAEDSYPNYDADSANLLEGAAGMGMKFDMLRCLMGRPKPWFLMECCIDGRQVWGDNKLKPPGLHHLEMFQALAHGANGTLYFQWRQGRGGGEKYHGAVVHHNHAEERRSFLEVQALSRRYEKLAPVLETQNTARVALLQDWESRWAWSTSKGVPQGGADPVPHAVTHYRALWERGIAVDYLGTGDDFSGYQLVLLPRGYLLPPGLAARLKEYVRGGGTLVITAMSGMVNETNLCWRDGWPGDGLEEVIGAWMEEPDLLKPGQERAVTAAAGNSLGLAGAWKTGQVATRSHAKGAEALLEYAEGWMSGQPALTRHRFGAGTAYWMACDLELEGLRAFYGALANELRLPAFYPDQAPLPAGVSAVQRGDLWFLLNFAKGAVEVPLPRGFMDLETGDTIQGQVQLVAWEARVLR